MRVVPRSRPWLVVTLGVWAIGCGGVRVAPMPLGQDLVWPLAEPRVRLVRIVALAASGRFGWLTGERAAPLFVRPYGIAWDRDELVVTDPGANHLVRIGADGKLDVSNAEGVGPLVGVAVCPASLSPLVP